MTDIQDIASGVSDNVATERRKLVDPIESIGIPTDGPATDIEDENSAFSLLKGMLSGLAIPAGSGAGDVNNNSNIYPDPFAALGEMSDAALTGSANQRASAIALLKGTLAGLGI